MQSIKIVPFAAALLATALAAPAFAAGAPDGATLTVLHEFGHGEGAAPLGGVLVTPDGTLYGTTSAGGRHNQGLVYTLSPDGTFTVLHAFGDADTDGKRPIARPTLGPDGMLYGTTQWGFYANGTGNGTVWRMATDGSRYEVIHAFPNAIGEREGAPAAELTLANDGRLYGTTMYGGESPACSDVIGCGIVFSVGTDGSYRIVHAFTDAEGSPFDSSVVQMQNGLLAGVNAFGGLFPKRCGAFGCGTAYAMTLEGQTVFLHSFAGADGREPHGTPVIGEGGMLYGVTRYGSKQDAGAEWHIDTAGRFAVDATFDCGRGACQPNVGLSPAPGRYGSTDGAGASAIVNHNARVVYPGLTATGALAQGPDGALYGTSSVLGDNKIFRLQPN